MKTYMPSDLLNSNYHYYISNDYYQVITNNNCYTNYNTTYCDCFNVYFDNDYLVSNSYSCNINSYNNVSISYSNFTSEFWYRLDITQILIIFLILFIFIIKYPYRIFSRLFGRWLKV